MVGRIIVNIPGIIMILAAGLIAFAVASAGSSGLATCIAASLPVGAIDLLWRVFMGRETLWDYSRGGMIYYVPIWIFLFITAGVCILIRVANGAPPPSASDLLQDRIDRGKRAVDEHPCDRELHNLYLLALMENDDIAHRRGDTSHTSDTSNHEIARFSGMCTGAGSGSVGSNARDDAGVYGSSSSTYGDPGGVAVPGTAATDRPGRSQDLGGPALQAILEKAEKIVEKGPFSGISNAYIDAELAVERAATPADEAVGKAALAHMAEIMRKRQAAHK